jgi:hypothetical protein
MKPAAEDLNFVFNCGVPFYLSKGGQPEGDLTPRLMSTIRSLDGAMGIP